jgi:transposase-like protein
MAQGKKFNDDVRERAYALFAVENNMREISRRLGVAESTLRGWKKVFDESGDTGDLAQLRAKKKEQFVKRSWQSIEMAQTLVERRLSRAMHQESAIDELIDLVLEADKEELDADERRAILKKLSLLRCDDVGKLTTTIGTLYDKQALASKEETEIVGGEINVRKFEDL